MGEPTESEICFLAVKSLGMTIDHFGTARPAPSKIEVPRLVQPSAVEEVYILIATTCHLRKQLIPHYNSVVSPISECLP